MASINVSVKNGEGNKITVTQKTASQSITVTRGTERNSITTQKPVIGTGDKNVVFEQVQPSATWTVTHSMNKNPSVTVVNSSGTIIYPSIKYDSTSQVTLTFSGSTSGKVYLN
tara:strand:- start:203 stop:541 length:339 start_codon:yes stop_codon:yes gene_type:complete